MLLVGLPQPMPSPASTAHLNQPPHPLLHCWLWLSESSVATEYGGTNWHTQMVTGNVGCLCILLKGMGIPRVERKAD